MTTVTEPVNLPDTLKTQTQILHQAAERHAFQRLLLQGRLPVERFAASQAQYMLVHRAVESHLRVCADRLAAFHGLIEPHHVREPLFADDLRSLGVDPQSVVALPVTAAMVREIDDAGAHMPLRLLGFLYVLEGSTNGSQFIAAALRKSILPDGRGLSALDPHGPEQRERWRRFRDGLSAVEADDSDVVCIVDAAQRMFRYAIDLMDSLAPNAPSASHERPVGSH